MNMRNIVQQNRVIHRHSNRHRRNRRLMVNCYRRGLSWFADKSIVHLPIDGAPASKVIDGYSYSGTGTGIAELKGSSPRKVLMVGSMKAEQGTSRDAVGKTLRWNVNIRKKDTQLGMTWGPIEEESKPKQDETDWQAGIVGTLSGIYAPDTANMKDEQNCLAHREEKCRLTSMVAERRRRHVLHMYLIEASLYIGITDIWHYGWTHNTNRLRGTFENSSSVSKIGCKDRFLARDDVFFLVWLKRRPRKNGRIRVRVHVVRIYRVSMTHSTRTKVTFLLEWIKWTLLDISDSIANNIITAILTTF